MDVHPSTLTRTVDRLTAAGWVTRAQNDNSRRETLIDLSAAGRELVERVTESRLRAIREIIGRLNPSEQRLVGEALQLFASAAGEPSPADLLVLGL